MAWLLYPKAKFKNVRDLILKNDATARQSIIYKLTYGECKAMNLMSLLWNKLRKKIITDWLLRIMCVHIYSKDHKTREADIFICVAIKLSDFVFNFYISASLLHVMSCQNAKTKCRSFF